MILDYSQFITEEGTKGIVNFVSADRNASVFRHDSICPFCRRKIENIVYQKHKYDTPEWLFGSFEESEYVIQCKSCGWWEYKYSNCSDAIIDGIRASDVKYSSAILKSYDEDSIDVPVKVLREYISKNPEVIYKINAHKMEDLVRSVFSDFFPSCTVKKFGQTRDGGRDGLLIDENGQQFLLSIKRRESPNATEGVSTLRDLIGATIVEDNVKGCIIVSTADHFSKSAKDYAGKVLSKDIITTFDLIDCKEFLRITDLTRNKLPIAWENLIKL
ncbi:restriction endonuclease [Blautia glucerasea]|uniref:restriction endonuclease n=1 Tax=Blautia glucerasea TaxID=536633 RepID=UPI0015709A1D|nr:restriction endonuclease [Blautia glucerasea]NSL04197.1 restriction endonuclease [Blautia glucerasea]